MMTEYLLLNCAIIFVARIADVSLGTLRTLAMVRGDSVRSWFLGFFEILIWIFVVSQVIGSVQQTPIYALFYAFGFATGTVVGITIERHLAIGDRVVLLFTRTGEAICAALRSREFAVTEFAARGRDGDIDFLFVKIPRRQVGGVVSQARSIDPACFVLIESVETLDHISPTLVPRTGWRTQGRKAK